MLSLVSPNIVFCCLCALAVVSPPGEIPQAFSGKANHIKLDHYFGREMVRDGPARNQGDAQVGNDPLYLLGGLALLALLALQVALARQAKARRRAAAQSVPPPVAHPPHVAMPEAAKRKMRKAS